MDKKFDKLKLEGVITPTASKSDAQRAILISALCPDVSLISNLGSSDDVIRMIKNIQILGAHVEEIGDSLRVTGIKDFPDSANLNVGESGLGFRLLTALSAVLYGEHWIFAEGTLMNRSQQFMIHTLESMGCKVESRNGYPPLNVIGSIKQTDIYLDASVSSQFLSGLLISLPLTKKKHILHVSNLKSRPYIDMTVATLKRFGVTIQNDSDSFTIFPNSNFQSSTYKIERDWSGASNWFVAAALNSRIKILGLNPNSFQADKAIINALENANCSVQYDGVAYTVQGTNRKAFSFDATDCPDLFPALVSLAAGCVGETTLYGASRLINKESDRASVLRSEFGKLGLVINVDKDKMTISGTGKLNGGIVDSHNDHRIAMSAAVAAVLAEGEIIIQDANCVSKSYPEFWEHLELLRN